MNSTWQNNSKGSPGFVYYNTEFQQQHTQNSDDFIEFSETSPQRPQFSPRNFSSPYYNNKKFGRGGYQQPNNRINNRYSPRGRYCGNSVNSPGSSFNASGSEWNNNSSGTKRKRSYVEDANSSYAYKFLEKSCLEDPWAELEQQWKQRQELENSSNSEKSPSSDSNE